MDHHRLELIFRQTKVPSFKHGGTAQPGLGRKADETLHIKCAIFLLNVIILIDSCILALVNADNLVSDRLHPRRRQSQATLLSHKQNLITGSANSPLTSPYNQFYLTNNVNSPHNG